MVDFSAEILNQASEALKKLEAVTTLRELKKVTRILLSCSTEPTNLFSIYNSKMNHFFVLAKDKNHAFEILEYYGHIINRKFAKISEINIRNAGAHSRKFFSAAARASQARQQGIVIENIQGFAVMKNNGAIFMPLSAVEI